MKIFLTGATGVLGRGLVRRLAQGGHSVVGVARDARGDEAVRTAGGTPVRVDVFDANAMAKAADGAEVVIHAATAIPAAMRTSSSDWFANDKLRREGTLALSLCAGKIGARLLVQQSVVWVAWSRFGEPFDETSVAVPQGIYVSAADGEQIVKDGAERYGYTCAILRCGFFYGAEATHTRFLATELRRRRAPIPGRGRAKWSLLHQDDAASAFATVATSSKGGLWHVVDDEPVAVGDFLSELAKNLGAPSPRRFPQCLVRAFVDERVFKALTRSCETSSARFKKEFGWSPQYPTYREGLRQVAQTLGSGG